ANLALVKGAFGFALQNGKNDAAWATWSGKYGVAPKFTGMAKAPFDTLADVLRALSGVMMDLYQRPDKVKEALQVILQHNIFFGMATMGGDTEYPLFMPLHRGAYPFLNPKQWSEFYWPTFKQLIETFWSQGKRIYFFAEGDWTP